MKNILVSLLPICVALVPSCKDDAPPRADISNGLIRAQLYLPDKESGYYRGTRFDWSGVISSLESGGHEYYGQWFEEYDPTLNDAIMGPVEDFSPLGFDGTNQGDSFIKIGVGVLQKPPEDSVYNRFKLYPVLNHGEWKIKKKADEISFSQTLNDVDYSYEYTKTIRLAQSKCEMEISHTLKNTGNRKIETNVYDHNFFVIDSQSTGTGFTVTFPFSIIADTGRIGIVAEILGNKLGFRRDLKPGETIRPINIAGFSKDSKDFDIAVENHETGAGVRVRGNIPLSKLEFWASLKTLCPETYVDINIEPGHELNWAFTYEFYDTR